MLKAKENIKHVKEFVHELDMSNFKALCVKD